MWFWFTYSNVTWVLVAVVVIFEHSLFLHWIAKFIDIHLYLELLYRRWPYFFHSTKCHLSKNKKRQPKLPAQINARLHRIFTLCHCHDTEATSTVGSNICVHNFTFFDIVIVNKCIALCRSKNIATTMPKTYIGLRLCCRYTYMWMRVQQTQTHK